MMNFLHKFRYFVLNSHNLVPRACDPREGNEGSGIIRFREDSDWPLKWMRSSILATIPGFRQRIIPEPSIPSRGSQARGTRLEFTELVGMPQAPTPDCSDGRLPITWYRYHPIPGPNQK